MLNKRILKPVALAFLVGASSAANAVELVQWKRLPIAVPLVKNQERVIFLDKNVRVGVSSQLQGQLRIQSASGALYLLATEEIEPARLQVQDVESGEIILLDIATVPAPSSEPLEPIRVIYDGDSNYQRTAEAKEQIAKDQDKALEIPAPVALTRYAAQMLYAPLRTVEAVPGIRQIPLHVTGKVPLFTSLPVSATAVSAFKMGSYTLTAVRVEHLRAGRLDLDPRDAQGKLYSITFQHNWLGTRGTAEDTTIAYVITRHGGLENALPAALFPQPENDTKNKRKGGAKK